MTANLGVIVHAKDDLRIDELPEPTPAADEAVLEITYGGICGSDLHYVSHGAAGESILHDPMVLGHEVVGRVLEPAADGSGPSEGTPVAVHPLTPKSREGVRYPIERQNLAPAATYLGSAATRPHTDGAFARRVALPTRMLRALPESIDLKTAALVEPASVAWHAVERAGGAAAVRGKRALVVGAGPIGALIVAVLKHHGAAEIIASDLQEKPREIARAVGATAVIDARDEDAVATADADVVFESSGSWRGLASAVRGATRGGRIVMVGLLPTGEQPALISLAIVRELELVGSFRFAGEIDDVIAALADGSLLIDPVVTHEFDVAEAAEAFELARDSSRSGKVLLRF